MTDLSKLEAEFNSLDTNIGGPKDGIYQGMVNYHRLGTTKSGKSQGNARIDIGLVIRGGDFNGRKVNVMFDLEQQVEYEGKKHRFGLKNYKSTLNNLGLLDKLDGFSEASLKAMGKLLHNCIVDFKIQTKNGYQNKYITALVQNPGEDAFTEADLKSAVDPDEIVAATPSIGKTMEVDIDSLLDD